MGSPVLVDTTLSQRVKQLTLRLPQGKLQARQENRNVNLSCPKEGRAVRVLALLVLSSTLLLGSISSRIFSTRRV